MSLILDALKRAESERGAQAMSGLPDLSPVPLAEPAGNLRWVLIGGAVIVIAGIAGWRYFSAAPKAESAALAAIEKATQPAPIEPVPAPMSRKPRAEPERPIIGTEEVASFDEVTGPEESQQLESPIVPMTAPTAAPAVVEAPPPVIAPPPAPPAPSMTPAAPRSKAPVKLNDMPPAYRASFPVFTIQVHSWDREASARFVRIDGYRYIEGEALPSGPRIVEITASGLVLDWQGERVIYPLH